MKSYRRLSAAVIIVLAFLVPARNLGARTATFTAADTPKLIMDNKTIVSSVNVTDMPVYTTGVAVTITELIHTADGELSLFLISPRGTRIELCSGIGANGDSFIQTVFDNDAQTHITAGAAPFTGTFQPFEMLGELQSENPNGTWTLEITDTAAGNTGVLNSWSLTISAGRPLDDWAIKKISTPGTDNHDVQFNGSHVVWRGYDGHDTEIYLHNAKTGITTVVTNNDSEDTYPRMWGPHLVWMGFDGTDTEIFHYNINTGVTTRITNNNYDDMNPEIYGSKVVWYGCENGDTEIFLHDITTGQTRKITNSTLSDVSPQIYRGFVVWEGLYGDSEIMLYNLATDTTTQITGNDTDDCYPHVYGSYVTWSGWDATDTEVFLYNIQTSTTITVTENVTSDWYPLMYGPNIVWQRYSAPDRQLCLYDINTRTTVPFANMRNSEPAPRICNGNVVWCGGDNGSTNIFLYEAATGKTLQITNGQGMNKFPDISGSKVAWESSDANGSEIHLAMRKVCMVEILSDLDRDCRVDLKDFVQWSQLWLTCNLEPAEACWKQGP